MNKNMIDARFGIAKMKGEELIFSARPSGFVRLQMVTTALSVVGVLLLPFVWVFSKIANNKFRFWLTNRRIILSSGFIGFKVRSIPLERVSDVSLSRTLPEMLSGVSSLVVRDMTGEAESGASMIAIDNAADYQRQILEEVRRVNSELATV